MSHAAKRSAVGSFVGRPAARATADLPAGAWRLASTPVLIDMVFVPPSEIQHVLFKRAALQQGAEELIQRVAGSGKILPLTLFCL